MAIRSLLLVLITTALFSFKGDPQHYVHFFNSSTGETTYQWLQEASQAVPYVRDTAKKFSIYDEDMANKQAMTDPAGIKMIKDWIARFQYDPALFRHDVPFSIYSMGEIKLREHVLTKLFYIEVKDKANSRELKLLMGVNMVNRQVVSIIELSRNLLLLGFSNYTYSIWHKNKFKIVNPIASDVTGPGIKHAHPDAYTVKMEDDGRLH